MIGLAYSGQQPKCLVPNIHQLFVQWTATWTYVYSASFFLFRCCQWWRQNFSAAGAPEFRLGHLQKIMRPFLISSRSLLYCKNER